MNSFGLAVFRAALAVAMVSFASVNLAAAAELRAFDAGSLAAIRAAHPGKPFVLAFWSTQCEPCREEMALWRALRREHPALPVILVATDPLSEHQTIQRFLARYSPGSAQTWAFADEFTERVRYAVDPGWRGELPRSYFFDAEHRAEARSGLVDPRWIQDWASRQTPSARKP